MRGREQVSSIPTGCHKNLRNNSEFTPRKYCLPQTYHLIIATADGQKYRGEGVKLALGGAKKVHVK